MGFEDIHINSTIAKEMSKNSSIGNSIRFPQCSSTFYFFQDWSPNVSSLKKASEETTVSAIGRLNSSTESDQETNRIANESE